jgi:hypothetical protein
LGLGVYAAVNAAIALKSGGAVAAAGEAAAGAAAQSALGVLLGGQVPTALPEVLRLWLLVAVSPALCEVCLT